MNTTRRLLNWAELQGRRWLGRRHRGGRPAPDTDGAASLTAHSAEFREEIIEMCEGVHVAVGYGLANSILIDDFLKNMVRL